MSIKIMTRVWEYSNQGGSELLLLLAIADNANDKGFAWPGQEYLANKIRMNKRSVSRLAKKSQEAGELFIHSRADQGKVTQYIVTIGMTWADFADSLQTHLKYSDEKCSDLYPWFSKSRGDNLSTPDDGGVTQLCPRGGDNLSGGVDIAMSPEPSLTVNKPSISPNGGNGSTNTNKQPTASPQKTNTTQQLTEQQTDELLIFGKHPDNDTANPSFDTIQEIQNAGWQIRNHIVEQAIVYYLEAVRQHHTAFAVPNNESVRKDWYKTVNGHLQDYRVDDLKVIYPAAIERLKERGMTFSRPGSLTKSLPDVAMETQTGDVVAWL